MSVPETIRKVTNWLCLLLFFCGCGASSFQDETGVNDQSATMQGQLTISGSSTVAPLVAELARRFESQQPGVRIDVQSGGSGKGIADVQTGVVDIGMASRGLKDGEHTLTAHQIAADGVGLIVHSSNSVKELTHQQVVDIYQGMVSNWKDVGGADLPILIVHKAAGRATQEVFLTHFEIDNRMVSADVIVGENEHAVQTVSGHPGAIGYVSVGTAEADIESGRAIRLLPLNGVAATSANVAQGTFPMSRPLNLITTTDISPLARDFISFCQSEAVHDIVVAQYFVPIRR